MFDADDSQFGGPARLEGSCAGHRPVTSGAHAEDIIGDSVHNTAASQLLHDKLIFFKESAAEFEDLRGFAI